MDLWIRAQNKTHLQTVGSLEIEENSEGYVIWADGDIIGTYKTKERALEVLNDIQLRIEILNAATVFDFSDKETMEQFQKVYGSNMVGILQPYQMPEE